MVLYWAIFLSPCSACFVFKERELPKLFALKPSLKAYEVNGTMKLEEILKLIPKTLWDTIKFYPFFAVTSDDKTRVLGTFDGIITAENINRFYDQHSQIAEKKGTFYFGRKQRKAFFFAVK